MKSKKCRRRCSFKNCTVRSSACHASRDDVTLTFNNPIASVRITLSHKAWASLVEEVATKTITVRYIHAAKMRAAISMLNKLHDTVERAAICCPKYVLTEKEIVP